MFGHLLDLAYRRTAVQAIGFYLVYLIAGIAGGAMLGFMAGLISGGADSFETGLTVGIIFAVVACPTLAFAVLYAKGLIRNIGYLLVAVLCVPGAYLGGFLLGLMLVAFLTTRTATSATAPVEAGPTFA